MHHSGRVPRIRTFWIRKWIEAAASLLLFAVERYEGLCSPQGPCHDGVEPVGCGNFLTLVCHTL